jgi:hypothetical protein
MRTIPFLALAAALAAPQSVAAADAAISCVLTKENILFTPDFAQAQNAAEKDIAGVAHFKIDGADLTTSMGAPCDRVAGAVTDAAVDASCTFAADKNSQVAIRLAIDRQAGIISETWNIVESDGSTYRYLIDGTCNTRQPDRLIAGLAHPVRQD